MGFISFEMVFTSISPSSSESSNFSFGNPYSSSFYASPPSPLPHTSWISVATWKW